MRAGAGAAAPARVDPDAVAECADEIMERLRAASGRC